MDGFKTFYNEKKGKQILFFAFYLIFFIFLAIYMRTNNTNKPIDKEKEEVVEKITTYDLSNLINNDYEYRFVILDVNQDGTDNSTTFTGTKNNIDYANFENKYFLDIYNVNQLLKRSKYVSTESNVLKYELNNSEINDILLTQKKDGVNKIEVYVNENGEVFEIIMDLTNYFEKEEYVIEMIYTEVDNNENSPS